MRDIQLLYHRPGKGTQRFSHRLVLDHPEVKVLLMDTYPGSELRHDGAVMLSAKASGLWFVFPHTWYDIGAFHDADDRCTGWYTNLCRPVVLGHDIWEITDLFLDLWQPARHGPAVWLDDDEYEAARLGGTIDEATHHEVTRVRREIDSRVQAGKWPPPVTREMDLTTARRLADEQE